MLAYQETVDRVMWFLDSDGSGDINYEEFVSRFLQLGGTSTSTVRS